MIFVTLFCNFCVVYVECMASRAIFFKNYVGFLSVECVIRQAVFVKIQHFHHHFYINIRDIALQYIFLMAVSVFVYEVITGLFLNSVLQVLFHSCECRMLYIGLCSGCG